MVLLRATIEKDSVKLTGIPLFSFSVIKFLILSDSLYIFSHSIIQV